MRLPFPSQNLPAPRPANCLNCNAAVPPGDTFCGNCGQENEASPVSFRALVREAWEEFVRIDATLLRTLRFLAFRPGFLSAEYVRGRRTAYLSPFKMYFAVSAVYFLLWGLIVPFDQLRDAQEEAARVEAKIMRDATAEKENPAKKSAVGEAKRPAKTAQYLVGQTEDGNKLVANDDAVTFFRQYRRKPFPFFGMNLPLAELPETVSRYRDSQQQKPVAKRDAPIKHFLTERAIRLFDDPVDSARNLFSTALPFVLLIHLPLFAVWMRIIYFRQKRLYVEHLVFVLHTHTFFFLLMSVVLFVAAAAKSFGMSVPIFEPLGDVGSAYHPYHRLQRAGTAPILRSGLGANAYQRLVPDKRLPVVTRFDGSNCRHCFRGVDGAFPRLVAILSDFCALRKK